MYTILVIDDEFWIRKWLENIFIEDDEYHMSAACENAQDAFEVLRNRNIDIVITDINMPIVSGLELIKTIKEYNKEIPEFIIISGYDKFEYAKEAIDLEVVGYLLKPIDKNELYKMLNFAKKNIEAKRKNDLLKTNYVEMQLRNMNAKHDFHFEEKGEVLSAFSKIDLKNTSYVGGILVCKAQSNISKEDLRKTLLDIKNFERVLIFKQDKNTFLFILVGVRVSEISKINLILNSKLSSDYYIGISKIHKDIRDLEKTIEEIKLDFVKEFSVDYKNINSKVQNIYDRYIEEIKNSSEEKLYELGKSVIKLFTQNRYDVEGCHNFYFLLTSDVIKNIKSKYNEKMANIDILIQKGHKCIAENKTNYSISLIVSNYENYYLEIIKVTRDIGHKSIEKIVEEVMVYIKRNYDIDINLVMVADKFGVNSSYLSKKFKDITKKSFVSFLTYVRIEQAKKMLLETNEPIKLISRKVGFNEPKYFSKVFMLNVGYKPSAYREIKTKDE